MLRLPLTVVLGGSLDLGHLSTKSLGRVSGRTSSWNSFWVFRGAPGSRLLPQAVPFGRREAEATLGPGLRWRAHRSELQTIGSYSRAVRRLTGAREAQLRRLCSCPS
jgi:hypothetical protein